MTRQRLIPALAACLLLSAAPSYSFAQAQRGQGASSGHSGGQPQGIGNGSQQDRQPGQATRSGANNPSPSGMPATTTTTTSSDQTTKAPPSQGTSGQEGPPEASGGAEASKRGPDSWMSAHGTWATFNGDLEAQKFSTASQLTPDNVKNLRKAWEYHTGDVSDGRGDKPMTVWSATPLFVNDTLYLGTPFYRIIALDPGTGQQKWAFDPHAVLKALTQPDLKNRGVAYWQTENPQADVACQKMVYIGTMDAKLYGVDADTGKACPDFGQHGMVDVNQWNSVNAKWPLSLLQPPTVYHDTLYLGWAGKDWADEQAPPGTVFALDARTGKLKWTFHALPPEAAQHSGTSNVWASMSLDPKTGMLYIPVSSPSPNFYGGDRKEKIPLGTSITALDADTGKVVWSRQLVHHDIWDLDANAAPTLVDVEKDGKTIPALVETTKQGFLFVLNRQTGEPIYPVEERPVPKSDIPGEEASPTQPYVATPAPTIPDKWPGVFPLADWISLGSCSRQAEKLRYDGRFTPPSLQGTITYPPTTGGTEWGGGAVDPRTGIFVVNSSSVVQIYRLIKRKDYQQQAQNGESSGYYPQEGAPYGFQLETFLNWAGMPCWNPPYGTIAAYDLKTGKRLWNEPFGEVQKYGFYMPESWGSVTIGSPVITQSGLIFIGASMDSRVRALDLKTGATLWSSLVDAPAVSMPAIYNYKGTEYVTFAAGGNSILLPKVSDQVISFALPH
jgi:quinoprotein glucose dehydrogenase